MTVTCGCRGADARLILVLHPSQLGALGCVLFEKEPSYSPRKILDCHFKKGAKTMINKRIINYN